MIVLALDSSGLVASVAVAQDDQLLAEYTVNYKKTHSQTLLPMLDEIASMIDLDLKSIDAIAIAEGPGSFTGLRIGSATAKGLGLALDRPIIPVPTVNGLAYNMVGCQSTVCPLMDARRGQVYTGLYTFDQTKMKTVIEQCAVDIHEIITRINAYGKPCIFLGDGVPVFRTILEKEVAVPHDYAPLHASRQRAGAVAALAMQYATEGRQQTATEHQPIYLRLSQAEREKMEQEQ